MIPDFFPRRHQPGLRAAIPNRRRCRPDLLYAPRTESRSFARRRPNTTSYLPWAAFTVFLMLFAFSPGQGQRIGDQWATTRGDATPHQRYTLSAITTSGGIDGAGNMAWILSTVMAPWLWVVMTD